MKRTTMLGIFLAAFAGALLLLFLAYHPSAGSGTNDIVRGLIS